jgi:hypothetical protein
MAEKTLNDIVSNLLKISQGDMDTLTRTTAEFARNITQDTKLPVEPGASTSRSQPPTLVPRDE